MHRRPAYPFLLGAFPVISLWSANVEEARIADVAIALLAAMVLAWLAVAAAGVVVAGRRRAAALGSVWALLFLSYDRIARVGAVIPSGSIDLARWPYVTAFAVAMGVAAAIALRRASRGDLLLTRTLTVVAAALVAVTSIEIAAAGRTLFAHDDPPRRAVAAGAAGVSAPGAVLPDIYYIVLDGYASFDTLRDVYGFDNSAFYTFLRRSGFTIAAGSRSNYPMTLLSIASSLNMQYLDDALARGTPDHGTFVRMIHESRVLAFLRDRGYRIVHFSSGWDATETNPVADVNVACGHLSDFAAAMIRSTFVRPIDRYVTSYVHPRRITCELEQLHAARDGRRPSFVFAHIVAPHPPFAFGADGEWLPDPGTVDAGVNEWEDRAKYIDEIRAINRKLRAAVQTLLRDTGRPVMIVLQGDHGPALMNEWAHPSDAFLRERLTIFNAYLVPPPLAAPLYSSMTPVNSFRALLSARFGADLPPLPDRTYFATYDDPFALVDVTDRLNRAPRAPYHSVSGTPPR